MVNRWNDKIFMVILVEDVFYIVVFLIFVMLFLIGLDGL